MNRWQISTDQVLEETVYAYTHPSGLEIYFIPKVGFAKKYAFFGTRYGSFHNCFSQNGERHCMPRGIAHFLEHKIFEDKDRSIFDKFAAFGASVNAYTSFNATVYHFSTIDQFDDGLAELLKFVQRVNLTEENVEKEKGIIVQELKSYEDDPEYMVFFNLLKALYEEHPIRDDIGGTEESVNAITKAQLETCYESFYAPENMVLIISGDIDPKNLLDTIEANLTEGYLARKTAIKESLPNESLKVYKPYTEAHFDVPMPLFEMGIKGYNDFADTDQLMKTAISVKLILDTHFGKGSDFYKNTYNEGLINSTFGMDFTFGENYAYYMFGGESKNPELVVERIKQAIGDLMTEELDLEGFERIRKKMIGRLISSANSVQYVSSGFTSYLMKGLNLFDYIRAIGETKPDLGMAYIKETFKEDHIALSVVKQEE